MEIKWIIDRISENIAAVEYKGQTFEISALLLPEDAKEGSVLSVAVDLEAENERKNRIKSLKDKLFKND